MGLAHVQEGPDEGRAPAGPKHEGDEAVLVVLVRVAGRVDDVRPDLRRVCFVSGRGWVLEMLKVRFPVSGFGDGVAGKRRGWSSTGMGCSLGNWPHLQSTLLRAAGLMLRES